MHSYYLGKPNLEIVLVKTEPYLEIVHSPQKTFQITVVKVKYMVTNEMSLEIRNLTDELFRRAKH